MKNLFKFFGIIALVAVLGFVASCGNPAGGGGGTGGGEEGGGGSDGRTWTVVTNSTFNSPHILAIAYGNGRFVAVGYYGKMAVSTGY